MTSDTTPQGSSGNERSFLSRIFSGNAARAPLVQVTLISRNMCPLCDEARETLLLLSNQLGFEIVEQKIDGDKALEDRYGLEVPVVLVDGARHAFGSVDPQRLQTAVESARRQRAPTQRPE